MTTTGHALEPEDAEWMNAPLGPPTPDTMSGFYDEKKYTGADAADAYRDGFGAGLAHALNAEAQAGGDDDRGETSWRSDPRPGVTRLEVLHWLKQSPLSESDAERMLAGYDEAQAGGGDEG